MSSWFSFHVNLSQSEYILMEDISKMPVENSQALHKLTRQNQKESVEIDSLDIKLLDSFNGAPLQTFNGQV